MSSISYFAPALNSSSRVASLAIPSKGHGKKRKRDAAALESKSTARPSKAGPSQDVRYTSRSTQSPAMSGETVEDQDAAFRSESSVQTLEESLPGSIHRSLHHSVQKVSRSRLKQDIADELATLKPPLLYLKGSADTTEVNLPGDLGIRLNHLAAVTAILHRSLLEGEFVRAGRAWGMLLRAESNGHAIDLRANDRWGIGAEILLRQHRGSEDIDRASSEWFSRDGLERAKAYYGRLVLQYPYRRVAPNATGPLEFYIAMFGLWIYSVNEQHLLELIDSGKNLQASHRGGRSKNYDGESDSTTSSSYTERREPRKSEQIRQQTLVRAEEIAARLEELLVSPPYIDHSSFRKLREMVALWIRDLSFVDPTSENRSISSHGISSPTLRDSDETYTDHDGPATTQSSHG